MSTIRLGCIALCLAILSSTLACADPGIRLSLSNPDGGDIRALIIGIDAYQHVRQLKGSVADARDIEGVLRSMGTQDVLSLIDAEANRTNVLQKISDLVQRTNRNDQIILAIAGHGAQEPETIKGSEPDGMQDVFLLPGFEATPEGSKQRILGSEFNHFMKQFELRGAKVLFVADTCHGGGLARDVDPRAAEMSFRQVPSYRLTEDKLQPVIDDADPITDLDLDRTTFLAAVDRNTKAPEVKIPSIDGLRGALSYAVARALEGKADADRDGRITVKELFANVRQVVYQLSEQRQNIVTKTSPGSALDREVVFKLTPGSKEQSATQVLASSAPDKKWAVPPSSSPSTRVDTVDPSSGRKLPPIRLAALDGNSTSIPKLASREADVEVVTPLDNPDLIWDPKSHDVISWGDVVAYDVAPASLGLVVDRTAAVRELKRISVKSPQPIRIGPDDTRHHDNETVQIELSDVARRSVIVFDISGDGTVQMLYPIPSDTVPAQSDNLRFSLRVQRPFGAEQVIAISTTERLEDLERLLIQVDHRKAPGAALKAMGKVLPADARIGSIAFFTSP